MKNNIVEKMLNAISNLISYLSAQTSAGLAGHKRPRRTNESLSAFEKRTGIHFTTKHTGKMTGMISLSTSVKDNPICKIRAQVPGSICEKCFAARQMDYQTGMRDCFARNLEILSTTIIDAWPAIDPEKYPYFRYESFGDLASVIQAINYINLATVNPAVKFAWWTKNPEFIAAAIGAGYKIPRNLVIIQSSCFVNNADTPKYDFIDHIFTVYDKDHTDGVKINCGARNCKKCGRCYTKRTALNVNEILK